MDAADGERMFRHACALGLEGIVSKRLDKLQLRTLPPLEEGQKPGLRSLMSARVEAVGNRREEAHRGSHDYQSGHVGRG
jgi:hypothetical protein